MRLFRATLLAVFTALAILVAIAGGGWLFGPSYLDDLSSSFDTHH